MIILVPWFVKLITFGFARAITFYPFVFLTQANDRSNTRLMNHERIHLRQQLELFIIPFYLLYFGEYLTRRLQGKNHREAYRAISFEREAYDQEVQLDYLANRPIFAFRKYLL
ncbi:hypothetical protein [Tunicatimonas pelagia]|uniref:hypothetical protein n=1 Tax=Tunicatimonas pelagia TaxID=931531 RepID=UPI002665C5C0|nr:hypothetical protein [Tunicatimonas pelagia]WKN42344.1 hypothetical protein P0M28_25240 [Tunicatimonas pelagia]